MGNEGRDVQKVLIKLVLFYKKFNLHFIFY